jgi:tetratricopeptide (TPR) repeat protein
MSVSPRGRQVLLWSGAVAVVLLLCAITFAVVRYRTRPAPVVAAEQTPTPVAPPVAVAPPEPPENPNKALNEQDLTAAREQMATGDFAAALRDHLQPVLEREPENAAALELKKQADDAIALAATTRTAKNRAPKPEPTEPEAPGIPKKPGELGPDYVARVKLIQTALADGKSSLDKQDYVAALNRFRVVDREQPKYQGVDALIADATSRQQKATEVAVTSGQQNEQAGKLLDARRWYERALQIDPTSTSARERRASVVSRMNTEATKLYNAATFALKAQDTAGAIVKFQQVLDMLMPGDEIREKAAKELEALKR